MKKYYIKYIENGVWVVLINGDICFSGSLARCCAHVEENAPLPAPDPDTEWNIAALLMLIIFVGIPLAVAVNLIWYLWTH